MSGAVAGEGAGRENRRGLPLLLRDGVNDLLQDHCLLCQPLPIRPHFCVLLLHLHSAATHLLRKSAMRHMRGRVQRSLISGSQAQIPCPVFCILCVHSMPFNIRPRKRGR